ncbi:AN1-type zinc finger protein 2A-like [Penaeus japonicus]|uniref:AN1-type zinc finger protein 2A-like n=1 Tax=Penaeus japonicus TaxID=27405 RepID=UPI001C70C55F|nr:AN1-type zinc finger protein 2A-like [Penaeus japonicus]
MELPHLGTNCAEPTCRQLDFLPFTCNMCKKEFCVDHHKYEDHSCPESYKVDVRIPICPLCNQPVPSKRGEAPDLAVNDHMENNCKNKNKKIYTNKCSANGCKTKEMIPVSCNACGLNYCLRHRHTTDHDCKGPAATSREKAGKAAMSRSSTSRGQSNGTISRGLSNLADASAQGIRRYFSPSPPSTGPRPTGHSQQQQRQPVRTPASVSSLQGGMSEDEALARAMAASVQDANKAPRVQQQQPSRTGSGPQESEEEQLARAIAASLEETSASSAARNQQGNNNSNCNVC